MEEYARGDYKEAMASFAKYLRRFPKDVEILRLLAAARLEIPEPNGKHLLLGMQILERALAIEPEHDATQRRLMEVYRDLGRNLEARRLAEKVLVRNPKDEEALWTLAVVLERTGEFQLAIDTAERYLRLRPDDLKGHLLVVSVMKSLEKSDEEILERARQVVRSRPDERVYRLVLAHAQVLVGRNDDAREELKAVADAMLDDTRSLEVLAQDLQRVGLLQESVGVLDRIALRSPQSPLHLLLVRHWYSTRKYDAIVRRVDRLEEEGRFMEPEMEAFAALALARLDRAEEARDRLSRIRSREQPDEAAAWRSLVSDFALEGAQTAKEKVRAGQSAVQKLPDSGYSHFCLARAWEDAREPILAIEQYGEAIRRWPGWIEPLARCANLLAETGRLESAAALTEVAHRIDPQEPRLRRVWALVQAWQLPRMSNEQLEMLQKDLSNLDEPEFIPLAVGTLVRLGKPEEATSLVRGALDPGHTPERSTLLTLARVCDLGGLPLAEPCLRHYEERFGRTAELGAYRALRSVPEKGRDGAIQVLEEERKKSAEPDSPEWAMARIRILDGADSDDALEQCREISERFSENLEVQSTLLASSLAWRDPPIVERAIALVKSVSGEAGLTWKMNRARLLLLDNDRPDPARVQEALELLREVVARIPDVPRIRYLLAAALERTGDVQGAIDQLDQAIAASAGPFRADMLFRTADLYRKMHEFDSARERLERIATETGAGAAMRIEAARRLIGTSDYEPARAALAAFQAQDPDMEKSRLLLLAETEEKLGDLESAERLVETLMQSPNALVLQFAAGFYQRHGRAALASEALERLADVGLQPWQVEAVRAEFESTRGRTGPMFDHYDAALKLEPKRGQLWYRCLSLSALAGERARFEDYLDRARRALPEDALLEKVATQREGVVAAVGDELTAKVVHDVFAHPEAADACLEAIRVVQSDGALLRRKETADRVAALAKDQASSQALHALAIELYAGAREAEEVVRLAQLMEERFPWSSDASRLLARFLLLTDRPAEALPPAEEWARRQGGREPRSASFLAAVHLELGNSWKAQQILEPLTKQDIADPELDRSIHLLLWQAQIRQSREPQALAEYRTFLKKGPAWRQVGLTLGASVLKDEASAARWIDAVAADIGPDELSQRYVLMAAWAQLARRAKNKDVPLARLRALLEQIGARDDLTADQSYSAGVMWEAIGDPSRAEKLYRQALAKKADHPLAANNLAMILVRSGRASEALELAKMIVAAYPKSLEFRDTLAQVLHGCEQWDAALDELATCRETDPENPRWPVAMLDMLLQTPNRRVAAEKLLAEIGEKFRRPLDGEWEARLASLERQLQ